MRMWKKELGGILQLVSYAEGELICAQAAPEANATELVSLNPENHDIETLCRLEGESGRPQNVVTDAERGQVFYTVNNQVWELRTSGGVPQQIAALLFRDPMACSVCAISKKVLVIASSKDIYPGEIGITRTNELLNMILRSLVN